MVRVSSAARKKWKVSPLLIVSHFVMGLACLHVGLLLGANRSCNDGSRALCDCPVCPKSACDTKTQNSGELLPRGVQGFIRNAAVVGRDEFTQKFDIGVPWDDSDRTNQQVMILYNHEKSLPNGTATPMKTSSVSALPYYSVEDATSNCETMKVVLQRTGQKNMCLAVVGQWDSHHVHKFMRLPQQRAQPASMNLPFRYVSRLHQPNGRVTEIPTGTDLAHYHNMLQEYLAKLPSTLAALRPIAEQAASDKKTIIVMVCNQGQSELLQNFACAARARGLDVSHVLVFCSDEYTCQLARGMGLFAFDITESFGHKIPSKAARSYGDKTFTAVMMSKVYVVHVINSLGYNVLFQDADIVWYQNPLDFVEEKLLEESDFDIFFQDDGAHSPRYAPYSPNTGFYFVRHNERTQLFMDLLARNGDMIQASGSHQSALNAVLSEQASMRGLRVKVFGRETKEGHLFPGGYHFHRRRQFMKDLIQSKLPVGERPYIFHMSWTTNKNNKVKFFQQMGDWYLKDQCIEVSEEWEDTDGSMWSTTCCQAEPQITCHYNDKPSKIPCKSSPNIDGPKGRAFW